MLCAIQYGTAHSKITLCLPAAPSAGESGGKSSAAQDMHNWLCFGSHSHDQRNSGPSLRHHDAAIMTLSRVHWHHMSHSTTGSAPALTRRQAAERLKGVIRSRVWGLGWPQAEGLGCLRSGGSGTDEGGVPGGVGREVARADEPAHLGRASRVMALASTSHGDADTMTTANSRPGRMRKLQTRSWRSKQEERVRGT